MEHRNDHDPIRLDAVVNAVREVRHRRLPHIPGARTPPNQSGTYAFDVGAELRAVLTAGVGAPRSLVLAHLDYLHQARYPRFSVLTPTERVLVVAAPVRALRDLSLHWQYPDVEDEPLGLYAWKIRRVQQLVRDEVLASRFLDPAKGNSLVLFSDHGNRARLTLNTFTDARYHRVVLATFGVPSRDTEAPISLLDLGDMVGFPDASRPGPSPPVVEYTNVIGREWSELLRTASVRGRGEVILDCGILRALAERLRTRVVYPTTPTPTAAG